jgi:hypothetical protein
LFSTAVFRYDEISEVDQMLSGRLVHLVESHWDEIAASVIDQVRREPEMAHTRGMAEAEFRGWCQDLLRNLGQWLSAAKNKEEEIARLYEQHGVLRCEENVPLHEAVRALFIIRERVLDFVEQQMGSKDTLALYAEEELDRRLGRFFDFLTLHLVKGYETALRRGFMAARG